MTTTSFYETRFQSIQALRGITCLLIVAEHIRFLNFGAFGVDIFFAISGFMIMLSTHKGPEHFFGKRLIRIVPLYYLMTIGTYFLLLLFPSMFAQTTANPVYLLKSLLFIPFDIGDGVLQPLMRIGWTVNCEMFFYLLFFISMKLSHKRRGLICSALLLILVVCGFLLPFTQAPFLFYTSPVLLDFAFGILLYRLAQHCYQKRDACKHPSVLSFCALIFSFLLFVLLIITKKQINVLGIRRPLLWGIPTAMIVFCFFFFGMYHSLPKLLIQIGNISFSVYLLHYYPVLLLDRRFFVFDKLTPLTAFGALVALLVSLLFGFLGYFFIEKKLTSLLFKLLKS